MLNTDHARADVLARTQAIIKEEARDLFGDGIAFTDVVRVLLKRWPSASQAEVEVACLYRLIPGATPGVAHLRNGGISEDGIALFMSISADYSSRMTALEAVASTANYGDFRLVRLRLAQIIADSEGFANDGNQFYASFLWPARAILECALERFEDQARREWQINAIARGEVTIGSHGAFSRPAPAETDRIMDAIRAGTRPFGGPVTVDGQKFGIMIERIIDAAQSLVDVIDGVRSSVRADPAVKLGQKRALEDWLISGRLVARQADRMIADCDIAHGEVA